MAETQSLIHYNVMDHLIAIVTIVFPLICTTRAISTLPVCAIVLTVLLESIFTDYHSYFN